MTSQTVEAYEGTWRRLANISASRKGSIHDDDAARERAHAQFRWFAGGWKVNADLPTTSGFAGATQFVRPEDVAESILFVCTRPEGVQIPVLAIEHD